LVCLICSLYNSDLIKHDDDGINASLSRQI
jgi:hypothetical protein